MPRDVVKLSLEEVDYIAMSRKSGEKEAKNIKKWKYKKNKNPVGGKQEFSIKRIGHKNEKRRITRNR